MIHELQIAQVCETHTCVYCSRDLDLDSMTLTYEPDLKILKVYSHTKMNSV